MAQQLIALGTPPSGIDGDDARTAFQKTNANFTELYERIGGTGGVGVTIADANSPTASGFYLLSTAASGGVNGPPQIPSIAWSIIHISGSSNGNASGQIAFPLTSVAANKHRMFHRQQFGGTWSDWKEVLDVEAANAVITSVVAAFGLGVSQQPNWPNTSINDCSNVGAGVYRTLGGNTGMPAGWNTSNTIELQIRQSDSSQFQATQVLHNPGTNRTAFRHCTGASTTPANPTWGDWVIVSSEAYVTSTLASVLAGMGLGVTSATVVPMATVEANRIAGFMAISSDDATASGLPIAVNYVIQHIPGGSAVSGHKQIAYPLTSVQANYRRSWARAMWGSVWGPWEERANESMIDSKLAGNGLATESASVVSDLNTATYGGIYRFNNTAVNSPIVASGTLIVGGYSSGYTTQMVITLQGTDASLYNRVFTRTRNSSTWGPWKESTTEDLFGATGLALRAAASPQVARAALGLKSAALADIVGTVSQSGGVPTGAIIERGSNTNGEYVRYADGTQICVTYGRAVGFANSSNLNYNWTYPVGFAVIPVVSVNLVSSTLPTQKAVTAVAAYSRNLTSASCSALSLAQFVAADASGVLLDIVAIGRWF
ncbi:MULTISPECIES: pyocin knob domain-containing protein [Pseudomonas]|uniref:pyocin knob domain-containing protein n=1 Tax=Pseudomonas guariconensis TaxID=1288410 RepID=UPI0020972ACF|nr:MULTISPECIES: pyocin knob domain-containing protein [Pseudomonas]MCO7595082.1 pyocin knob domain-containing protein [Pseudomonas guariconensis]MCU7221038.1 pyocin knob domain-containing protein [Pseudomonas brassicacearum]